MGVEDLRGRKVVITGANAGIGRATAEALAARGASLLLAGRSEERTRPVIEALRVAHGEAPDFVELDLGDLASVRRAAEAIRRSAPAIDILIANAGLAGAKGVTADGFEKTFGVNHLGHFALVNALLEPLEAAAPSRVVFVASDAHYRAKPIDFEALRRPTATSTGFPEYCVSKLCNVLFARELARRVEGRGISVFAVHPGVIASEVWRSVPWPVRSIMKLFMKSNEQGALPSLFAATATRLEGRTGLYIGDDCTEKVPSQMALDEDLAAKLWAFSEAAIAPVFE